MAKTNILLEAGTNEVEIVEFYLKEVMDDGSVYTGYYGVNVAKVLEIIRSPQVTGLPEKSHPSVLGAFNLRNKVIPLVDLSLWLEKRLHRDGASKVIVTEFSQVQTAFLVSGVTRIHRLSWRDIEPPDVHVQQFSGDSITGVVKMEDRVILILDMERVVTDINPKLALKLAEPDHKTEDGGTKGLKALIADDSTSVRNMVARSLEKTGFVVTRAVNGRAALDQLLAWKGQAESEDRPLKEFVDVVISDIEMPGMDGHSLTRQIKEDPVLKGLPVILFSSLITPALRHKGQAVGADDQISKPDLSQLTDRARGLIEQYRSRQG